MDSGEAWEGKPFPTAIIRELGHFFFFSLNGYFQFWSRTLVAPFLIDRVVPWVSQRQLLQSSYDMRYDWVDSDLMFNYSITLRESTKPC